jgi:hypothetical protein
MSNPAAMRPAPSKSELQAEISRLRSHIHNLRSALRTTDARMCELSTRYTIFTHMDEAIVTNNKVVLRQWETNTY